MVGVRQTSVRDSRPRARRARDRRHSFLPHHQHCLRLRARPLRTSSFLAHTHVVSRLTLAPCPRSCFPRTSSDTEKRGTIQRCMDKPVRPHAIHRSISRARMEAQQGKAHPQCQSLAMRAGALRHSLCRRSRPMSCRVRRARRKESTWSGTHILHAGIPGSSASTLWSLPSLCRSCAGCPYDSVRVRTHARKTARRCLPSSPHRLLTTLYPVCPLLGAGLDVWTEKGGCPRRTRNPSLTVLPLNVRTGRLRLPVPIIP